MRVQMLGLCRFSYLGLRGYQVEHDSIAARRAYLYDPDRIEANHEGFAERGAVAASDSVKRALSQPNA